MRRYLLGFGLLSCLYGGSASAGGFYISDVGTRAMARGGAFAAAPDDLSALHYNPAGLALLSGFHFSASLQIVDYQATLERSCPCTMGDAAADAILQASFDENPATSRTPLAIPFIGLGYGFKDLGLSVAVGAWGPTSGRHDWGSDLNLDVTLPSFPSRAVTQPNRYSAIEAKNLEINTGLGVAYSPLSWLRIGGTAMLWTSGAEQRQHLWVAHALLPANDGPEDVSLDAPLVLDFRSPYKLGWEVGVSADIPGMPVGTLSVGSSFRGQRAFRAKGTIVAVLPERATELGVEVEGNDVEVELRTAPILRTGVQYRIPELFSAEVDFVYERWSSHDRILVRPVNIDITLPDPFDAVALENIPIVRGWEDTFSLRVGAEIEKFLPLFGLSFGYFFEPSAIPPEFMDASRMDFDKHGFSIGVSTTMYGLTLTVGGQYFILSEQVITNSTRRLTAAPDVDSPDITIIGNGTYGGSYFIGGASLAFSFDALQQAK